MESSSASRLVPAAPPATPKSARGCSTGCRVDVGTTTPLLCRNQHPHPHERIRTPHSAGQLYFCQSLQAAEPLGTAWARGRRGCVLAQPAMKVLAGCAARSRCRARPGSTNPPRAAAPSSFLALPSKHCRLPIFCYELIPNLLSEKDQTSPYVFVGCFLCLLLSRYPGFEVRLKGKRGPRVRGAQLGEAVAGCKRKTPETPAPHSTVTPCPTRDPPACSHRLRCCGENQRLWPRLFALMFYFF